MISAMVGNKISAMNVFIEEARALWLLAFFTIAERVAGKAHTWQRTREWLFACAAKLTARLALMQIMVNSKYIKRARISIATNTVVLFVGHLWWCNGQAFHSTPEPVLDFGPERGSAKGTMADLGPLIRHLVSTRLPSGGRAAFLSPLSPLYGTRPCV